jgi:hypothetical protein
LGSGPGRIGRGLAAVGVDGRRGKLLRLFVVSDAVDSVTETTVNVGGAMRVITAVSHSLAEHASKTQHKPVGRKAGGNIEAGNRHWIKDP